MSDLVNSIAYLLQFTERKFIHITNSTVHPILFPELLEEMRDFAKNNSKTPKENNEKEQLHLSKS